MITRVAIYDNGYPLFAWLVVRLVASLCRPVPLPVGKWLLISWKRRLKLGEEVLELMQEMAGVMAITYFAPTRIIRAADSRNAVAASMRKGCSTHIQR